jgi:hypothetical protein
MATFAAIFLLSATAAVVAFRRCPLIKAIGVQIDQVAETPR